MDRFRIIALHKLLISKQCHSQQELQVETILKKKASILLDGKRKRAANQVETISLLQRLSSGAWQSINLDESRQLLLDESLW